MAETGVIGLATNAITPSAPASGYVKHYVDANRVLHTIDSSGIDTPNYGATPYNFLINGGFDFAQRQTPGTFTTIATDKYSADRWRTSSQSASFQYARGDATAQAGLNSQFYGSFQQITNAGKFAVYQIVESSNCMPLRGQQVTFSIKMKASSAKTIRMAVMELQNAGTIDTIPTTFVAGAVYGASTVDPTWGANLAVVTGAQSKSATTSWQQFSVTVTLPTNSKNFICALWSDSQFSAADVLYVAEAGLYVGASAPVWQPRPIGQELALCQRYCYVPPTTTQWSYLASGMSATGAVQVNGIMYFPAPMRVVPTLVTSASYWVATDGVTATAGTGITLSYPPSTQYFAYLQLTVAAGLTQFRPYAFLASATPGMAIFDGEL